MAFAEERIGPAFMDVADRYRNDPQGALPFLTQKIKWGGEGNWGWAHMPRQRVTLDEANLLARWILSY